MGANKNQTISTKSLRQARKTIDAALGSDFQKMKRNEDCRIILSDVLHPEELKMYGAYSNMALFSGGMYKIGMPVRAEPTVTYRMISTIDTRAASNFIIDVLIKSQ